MARAPNQQQAAIVRRGRTAAQARGDVAEEQAAAFLQAQGLQIIARNVRCRGGEIDLICRSTTQLIFVEVRARQSQAFGGAAASITPHKQQRILHAAQWWLQHAGQRYCTMPMRCDAVLLNGPPPAQIDWITNAFSLDDW